MVARMYIWPRYALEIDGRHIRFSPLSGLAFARLFNANGGYVSTSELIDAAYFHDPEGGPLCANICIKVAVNRVRKLIAGTGLTIESRTGPNNLGYRLRLPHP